ncbi:unnamed protein product [Lymnaea stagnalis]|uniref:Uncharacterized protein n=1 Tax=Lymnaea stagnalis TaxID=6523 RepID=A0AAV2IP75_LYMST
MTLDTSHPYAILAIAGSFVHILEINTYSSVIFEAPCLVTAVALSTERNNVSTCAYITTINNKLWRVQIVTDSQKSISKTKEVKKQDEAPSKANEMEVDDIFGELLSEPKSKKAKMNDSSNTNLHYSVHSNTRNIAIKDENLIFESESSILDLNAFNDVLTLIIRDADTIRLLLLKLENKVDVKQKGRQMVQILQDVPTGLKADIFPENILKKKKILYIVTQQDLESTTSAPLSQTSSTPDLMSVPKTLFISLFGREACILNSPVLLLCCNNGLVYSYALKSTKSCSQSRLAITCQLNSDIVGVFSVSVTWPESSTDLNQDVVSALASALQNFEPQHRNIKDSGRGLLFCSASGECCLCLPPNRNSQAPFILMFSIAQPTVSCLVHDNLLIYSTGKCVEACEVKLTNEQGRGSVSVKPVFRTLLKCAKILKLIAYDRKDPNGEFITGITSNFEATQIPVCTSDSVLHTDGSNTDSFSGILKSIDACSEKLRAAKEKSERLDAFMLQMNIFTSLQLATEVAKHLQPGTVDFSTFISPAASMIECRCSVSSFKNGYLQEWQLKVELENKSTVCVSSDWSVVITLKDIQSNCHAQTGSNRLTRTNTFPLAKGLRSKSHLVFHIPLKSIIRGHTNPAFQVSVSLVLNFGNKIITECVSVSGEMFQKCHIVELHSNNFDVLNFLHKMNDEENDKDCPGKSNLYQSSDFHLLREINLLAQSRVKPGAETHPPLEQPQSLTVSLPVTSVAAQEHNLSSPLDVLKFLIAEDQDVLVADTHHCSCQFVGPSGVSVLMTVLEPQTGPGERNPGKVTVEKFVITLRSHDVIIISDMRLAIKERMQIPPEKSNQLLPKSKDEIQKIISTMEGIRENLRQGQIKCHTVRTEKLVCDMLNKLELGLKL